MKKPSIGKADGKQVTIDVERLVETRLLCQANSGAGKSWALRRILEQTFGKVQHIVIDSEGEFATLREKFDYVICAPRDADAVATPRTAALLARRLLETRASAILDIYDLKAHERIRFVRLFLEALINAPKKLWKPCLVVIDEAHIYCPEKGSAESSGAVIDLATRGRKRGFCACLATQRLSKLNKDAAAETLNKLVGRTGLDVDVKRAADELGFNNKEAMQTLRRLKPGEFYAFGPAFTEVVTRVTVGNVQTTHPKVGHRLQEAPPPASAKIKKILAELADLPEAAEKEVRTLTELKTENASLKRANTKLERTAKAGGMSEAEVVKRVKAEMVAFNRARSDVIKYEKATLENLRQKARILKKALGEVARVATFAAGLEIETAPVTVSALGKGAISQTPAPHRAEPSFEVFTSKPIPWVSGRGDGLEGLKAGAIKILKELAARLPAGYTKPQVGALTRYKHTGGTFGSYMSALRTRGFLEARDGLIFASEAGAQALGEDIPQAPSTHEEIMGMWK